KLSRILGIWVFLASCIGVWASYAHAFSPLQLDPVHGALGSLGWALFSIRCAGDRATAVTTSAAPADRAAGRRRPPPRAATILLTIGAVAGSVPMVLAWSVESLERALLAHAVSLAAAIALVAFAADLFDPRSRAEQAGFDAFRKPERRIAA